MPVPPVPSPISPSVAPSRAVMGTVSLAIKQLRNLARLKLSLSHFQHKGGPFLQLPSSSLLYSTLLDDSVAASRRIEYICHAVLKIAAAKRFFGQQHRSI